MLFPSDLGKFPKACLIPCSVELKAHSSTSANSQGVYAFTVTSGLKHLLLQWVSIMEYTASCKCGFCSMPC